MAEGSISEVEKNLERQLLQERSLNVALAKELEHLKEQLEAEKAEKKLPIDSLESGIHKDDSDELKALKMQLEEERSANFVIAGELEKLKQRLEAEEKFGTSLHLAYVEEKGRVASLLASGQWKEEEYKEMDAEYEKMEAHYKQLEAKLKHTEDTLTKAFKRLKELKAEKVSSAIQESDQLRELNIALEQERINHAAKVQELEQERSKMKQLEDKLTKAFQRLQELEATAFQEQERSHIAGLVLEEEWRNHAAKVQELRGLQDSSFARIKGLLQGSTGQKISQREEEADYDQLRDQLQLALTDSQNRLEGAEAAAKKKNLERELLEQAKADIEMLDHQ